MCIWPRYRITFIHTLFPITYAYQACSLWSVILSVCRSEWELDILTGWYQNIFLNFDNDRLRVIVSFEVPRNFTIGPGNPSLVSDHPLYRSRRAQFDLKNKTMFIPFHIDVFLPPWFYLNWHVLCPIQPRWSFIQETLDCRMNYCSPCSVFVTSSSAPGWSVEVYYGFGNKRGSLVD